MPMRNFLIGLSLSCSVGMPVAADINIGVPSWAAGQVISNILAQVLHDELGADVNLLPGTNPVIFEAMDKGDLDVHPDVWLPNQQNLVDTYVTEAGTVTLAASPYLARRGLCVNRAAVDALGIDDVYDLTDPDVARAFDSDGDGKGEYWVGAAGWASTTVELVRMHSYGISETFELVQMDEEAGLSMMGAAEKSGTPFATQCVRPNVMFKLADLVMLDEPEYDPAKWNMVTPTESPNWLSEGNVEVAWPDIFAQVAYATRLTETEPEAARILEGVHFETAMIEDFIFSVMEEKHAPEEVAQAWIAANPDVVSAWLGY